jgi:hypothetical protein
VGLGQCEPGREEGGVPEHHGDIDGTGQRGARELSPGPPLPSREQLRQHQQGHQRPDVRGLLRREPADAETQAGAGRQRRTPPRGQQRHAAPGGADQGDVIAAHLQGPLQEGGEQAEQCGAERRVVHAPGLAAQQLREQRGDSRQIGERKPQPEQARRAPHGDFVAAVLHEGPQHQLRETRVGARAQDAVVQRARDAVEGAELVPVEGDGVDRRAVQDDEDQQQQRRPSARDVSTRHAAP